MFVSGCETWATMSVIVDGFGRSGVMEKNNGERGLSNTFDNRTVRLERSRLSFTGKDIYSFIWLCNGAQRTFHSFGPDRESAVEEFKANYPDSRGCLLEICCA